MITRAPRPQLGVETEWFLVSKSLTVPLSPLWVVEFISVHVYVDVGGDLYTYSAAGQRRGGARQCRRDPAAARRSASMSLFFKFRSSVSTLPIPAQGGVEVVRVGGAAGARADSGSRATPRAALPQPRLPDAYSRAAARAEKLDIFVLSS
ncbi:unnamed protein product [Spodoptera exigua]|nr:unnamed protein product [Spodoptera exigua]